MKNLLVVKEGYYGTVGSLIISQVEIPCGWDIDKYNEPTIEESKIAGEEIVHLLEKEIDLWMKEFRTIRSPYVKKLNILMLSLVSQSLLLRLSCFKTRVHRVSDGGNRSDLNIIIEINDWILVHIPWQIGNYLYTQLSGKSQQIIEKFLAIYMKSRKGRE